MDRVDEVRILKNMAMSVGNAFLDPDVTQTASGFLAMIGGDYRQQLMVYGRAVNGWGNNPQLLRSLADDVTASRFAQVALADAGRENGECPMLWVTELEGAATNEDGTPRYNTNKSAFWRVVKATIGRLGIADILESNWPSSMVWSNLYKIAPDDGGNPSARLCNAQLRECIELFAAELSLYCPRRIVLATGLDWAEPFLAENGIAYSTASDSRFVEAHGEVSLCDGHTCCFVVAPHPQGKPEGEWVDAVVAHLGA
jgi:hypothetical protein